MGLITRASWGALSQNVPYSQPAAALPLYTSGLGWEIAGGSRGARIRHLHINPIYLLNNDMYVWHVIAFRGTLPKDTTRFQGAQANNTYPAPAAQTFDLDILYYSLLRPCRPAAAEQEYPLIADFEDDTGPSVNAGETLSVMILPCFVIGSVPAAGASAFVTGILLGGDNVLGGGDADTRGRSIPRGRLG